MIRICCRQICWDHGKNLFHAILCLVDFVNLVELVQPMPLVTNRKNLLNFLEVVESLEEIKIISLQFVKKKISIKTKFLGTRRIFSLGVVFCHGSFL